MNSDPVRVACLGAGYFSQFHREAWQRIDGAQLIGVSDRNLEAAQQTGVTAYADILQMVEAERPDLLDIITPPPTHLPAIRLAIESGVGAIVCQKPFCSSLDEARLAVDLAKGAGVRLVVHENFRFQPWYRKMADVIASGDLGDIHQLSFRMRTGDGQGPDAYLARQPYFQKMKRFLVHETAVHWIDVFRFLLGPVGAVYADLRKMNPAIEGEDAGYIIFEMTNNRRALFDGNRLLDHASQNTRLTFGEALVEGTAATLELKGNGAIFFRKFGEMEQQTILEPRQWPGFAGDCVHALQAHVVSALRNGSEIENEASEYLRVIEIEEAIYRSAATGQKQEI
ncbi:MAG: Gfo/Idh/MocA family oxidoreductase [Pseudomonadota bacterium]